MPYSFEADKVAKAEQLDTYVLLLAETEDNGVPSTSIKKNELPAYQNMLLGFVKSKLQKWQNQIYMPVIILSAILYITSVLYLFSALRS